MSEIVRPASPSAADQTRKGYDPSELNAELAAAALARELVAKWPKPAIDTRKFTIIHGLMQSLNHVEDKHLTYVDTSMLIDLMDRVSEKSVNVDGKLFNNIFAYLMKPKYIIQGMPQGEPEEQKPGLLSRMWQGITGRGKTEEKSA